MRKKIGTFKIKLPKDKESKEFFIWADINKGLSDEGLYTILEFNCPPEYHYFITSMAKNLQEKLGIKVRTEWRTTKWKDYLKTMIYIDVKEHDIDDILNNLKSYNYNYKITNQFDIEKDGKFIIDNKILEKI